MPLLHSCAHLSILSSISCFLCEVFPFFVTLKGLQLIMTLPVCALHKTQVVIDGPGSFTQLPPTDCDRSVFSLFLETSRKATVSDSVATQLPAIDRYSSHFPPASSCALSLHPAASRVFSRPDRNGSSALIGGCSVNMSSSA